MMQDIELFKPLQDFTGKKPLECVGEKIEVWTALDMLAKRKDQKDKPVVQYFVEKIKPFIIDQLPNFYKEVHTIQTVPTQLPPDLEILIQKSYG